MQSSPKRYSLAISRFSDKAWDMYYLNMIPKSTHPNRTPNEDDDYELIIANCVAHFWS